MTIFIPKFFQIGLVFLLLFFLGAVYEIRFLNSYGALIDVFLLLFFFGYWWGWDFYIFWAALIGMARDSFSPMPDGLYIVIFLMISFSLVFFDRIVQQENISTDSVRIFLGVFLYAVIPFFWRIVSVDGFFHQYAADAAILLAYAMTLQAIALFIAYAVIRALRSKQKATAIHSI